MKTDILIIGSGLAGMATALYLAELRPELQILIVSKAKKDESNTKYAQGGIAGVVQSTVDSFEQHIEDTMKAGHFLSDRKIVELVVKSAPKSIHDLERWGVNFDYKKKVLMNWGWKADIPSIESCIIKIVPVKKFTINSIRK